MSQFFQIHPENPQQRLAKRAAEMIRDSNATIYCWAMGLTQHRNAVATIKENVAKLRDLSPLWEMFKDGVDLSTIQWAAH